MTLPLQCGSITVWIHLITRIMQKSDCPVHNAEYDLGGMRKQEGKLRILGSGSRQRKNNWQTMIGSGDYADVLSGMLADAPGDHAGKALSWI